MVMAVAAAATAAVDTLLWENYPFYGKLHVLKTYYL